MKSDKLTALCLCIGAKLNQDEARTVLYNGMRWGLRHHQIDNDVMRNISHTGREAVRLLFSLSCEGDDSVLTHKALAFARIMQKKLRSGDIILHDKTGQFFVLLNEMSENEARDVVFRIIKLSGRDPECKGVEISFVMDSVSGR